VTKNSKWQRWKPWATGVGSALGVGFALLNVMAYRHAYTMTHFVLPTDKTKSPESLGAGQKLSVLLRGVTIPRPHSDKPVATLGPAARSVQIVEDGKVKLGAWYCSASSNAPLVILFHGYTNEKSSTIGEARVFLELGCSVLLVDFRGSGDSSEAYTTIGYDEAKDVATALRYAEKNLPASKMILYGQSMGAAAVLRAVAECGAKPDAVIIEAVFDTLLNTVEHRFEAMETPAFPAAQLLVFWGGVQCGFNGFKLNPVDYAKSVACPALFLHGGADKRAHVEEARRVFDAVPGDKEFKEFPGLGHASVLARFPGDWKHTVGDFLKVHAVLNPVAANDSR
jgi:uncharacterized protein